MEAVSVLDHGFVRLVDSMPAPPAGPRPEGWGPGDQRVIDAARVSIAGENVRPVSDDKKLLGYLLKNKHTTPFEQVRFTFHVKLPIFVARQWIRHRTGSFNEMSGRYGVLPDDFYVPERHRIQHQSANNKQGSGESFSDRDAAGVCDAICEHGTRSYELYQDVLKLGLARELARMVLPVNLYTQWYWTTDLHNLMHFMRLRLHSHAQHEVRVYAEVLLEMARRVAPCTVQAFEETLDRG